MVNGEIQKVQRGDIIHLDYDLWLADDNLLFDTTCQELADKHEITDENARYEPRALIVDEGKAVSGLYKSLLDAEVGKDYDIEVPPEEGLGNRDPKLVEWHMMNEIRRQKLEPVVGKEITIKDKSGRERTGIVTMVSPRRVRVDYNSPLAGKPFATNTRLWIKPRDPRIRFQQYWKWISAGRMTSRLRLRERLWRSSSRMCASTTNYGC